MVYALCQADGGAIWDGQVIQPKWRPTDNSSTESNTQGYLVFQFEHEEPGQHTLELTLDVKAEKNEDLLQIIQAIPRIPNARLRLDAPTGVSSIFVQKSYGAVIPGTLQLPTFVADIGPVDTLEFSWQEEPPVGEIDVEQYFWLYARPTQVDVRSIFSYNIEGDTVKSIDLQTDPRWQLSGQFRCDEHSIERVENRYGDFATKNDGVHRREWKRIVFAKPVAGVVTLRADFVLNHFNGIGKVQLPRIQSLHARSSKSMLALSCHPRLELEYPTVGLGTGFESAWERHQMRSSTIMNFRENESMFSGIGNVNEFVLPPPSILAQYDLANVEPTWTLSVRMPHHLPKAKVSHTFRFDTGDSTVLSVGEFQAEDEVFQQKIFVPKDFHIEQIHVFDAKNTPVDLRWNDLPFPSESTALSNQKLHPKVVFFRRAVLGHYTVMVHGHFATELFSILANEEIRDLYTPDERESFYFPDVAGNKKFTKEHAKRLYDWMQENYGNYKIRPF